MRNKRLFFLITLTVFSFAFSSCSAEDAAGGIKCAECEKDPCVCCKDCKKYICECPCEICEKFPCECCWICNEYHSPICCEICLKKDCICPPLFGNNIADVDPSEPYTFFYNGSFKYPLNTPNWEFVLNQINNVERANKDVIVDLSKTPMGYGSNNLFPFAETNYNNFPGADYIVSLILPEGAEYVRGIDKISSLKNLKYIKGTNVHTINPSAFQNCTSLAKISETDFPSVVYIASSAFLGCTSLTEVTFTNVKKIDPLAFGNCTSLKTARFLANPNRTTEGHPLKTWLSWYEGGRVGTPPEELVSEDSIFFNHDAFSGCVSLEVLDLRNAWNVFFGAYSLANIGKRLDIYLFDDTGAKSYGHPQTQWFLGGQEERIVSIEKINLIVPVVTPAENSQIIKPLSPGRHGIWVQLGDANQYGGNNSNPNYVEGAIERRSNLYN